MTSQQAIRVGADAADTPVISIRRAEIGDAGPLAELMTELGYPTTEDEMADRLRSILPHGDYLVAVAVQEGLVVGAVGAFVGLYLEMNGRYGRVVALSVAKGHRGRGIGARLLAHAESWLRAREVAACIVNSSTHRIDAHRFYEHNGYGFTGLRFYKEL
jgi:GNAT superfamily N-acetyltransferase